MHYDYRYPFTSNQTIPPMDWEEYVAEIATDMMKEQSPKRFNLWASYSDDIINMCINTAFRSLFVSLHSYLFINLRVQVLLDLQKEINNCKCNAMQLGWISPHLYFSFFWKRANVRKTAVLICTKELSDTSIGTDNLNVVSHSFC